MSHDLLAQMSSAARDDVLADPRWEDFARGALNDSDEADLLARARAEGVDEETIAALGPRSAAFDDRLAEAALAALKSPARDEPSKAPAIDIAAPPSAKVIPLRTRWPATAATALALAAAAGFLLWRQRPAELPVFAMTIEGGTHDLRLSPDDPGGVVTLAPGNRVVVTLRPDAHAPRRLAARGFLHGDGTSSVWPGTIDVADTGSVRLIAGASDIFRDAPAGRRRLCVSVGNPSSLPETPGAAPPPARAPGFVTVCRDLAWTGAPAER